MDHVSSSHPICTASPSFSKPILPDTACGPRQIYYTCLFCHCVALLPGLWPISTAAQAVPGSTSAMGFCHFLFLRGSEDGERRGEGTQPGDSLEALGGESGKSCETSLLSVVPRVPVSLWDTSSVGVLSKGCPLAPVPFR